MTIWTREAPVSNIPPFSAVINIKFEYSTANALLDTGASCSLIDLGSVRKLKLNSPINNTSHHLVDASGNNMEIIGSMDVPIVIGKRKLVQNVKVLNALTNRNIILGRDFLGKFDNVEFDFPQNKVRLCNNWSTCYTIESPEKVCLHHNVSIPGRSEGIVLVKCKKSSSLITADFEPVAIGGASGVYATRCCIIPDLDGIFNITLLNVNEHPISLGYGKHIGNLIPSDETIPQQDFAVITEQFARDVRCGESLLPNEKE